MTPLVSMKNIVKKFPGTVALKDVSLTVEPAEVHVLLGENGAGKSTLMKILSGIYEPTSGEIQLGDKVYDHLTPALSAQHGICIIYQELSVIDELSIEENLFVGKLPTTKKLGLTTVDYPFMRKKALEVLQRVGLKRDPAILVDHLSISEKQQVEIAKALVSNANILIMDEPTSSLTDDEVNALFRVIHDLKSQGVGIVYISHKLKEIPIIGDRVSILKDGAYIATYDAKTTPLPRLVAGMVGREIEDLRPKQLDYTQRNIVLSVEHLNSQDGRVRDVSFELYQGEILGFAGLIGSGRTELMETIFAARPKSSGKIEFKNRPLDISTPYDAVKSGLAFVTEDRRHTGFFDNFSVAENISIVPFVRATQRPISFKLLNLGKEVADGKAYRERLNIRCASPNQNITELSGGNQQKVVISKWLAAGSEFFIFDEPTRGIDIGAKSEIYSIMRDLVNNGKAVLMISSELPELLSVCDRIAVFNDGKLVTILDNHDATEENIMQAATLEEVS